MVNLINFIVLFFMHFFILFIHLEFDADLSVCLSHILDLTETMGGC